MPRPPETALGVDIGGTRVHAGVVTCAGHLLAHRDAPLPPEGEPAALRRLVAQLAHEVVSTAGSKPTACGVALPGVWDRRTGVMQRALNLPRLEGVQLHELFRTAVGQAVFLETDVNAALWAQWHACDPRPARLLYLSLGTGVGGAMLLDGRILRHTRGGAGHFGFLIVDTSPDAPRGRTSIPGCLSAIAAGPALHLAATGQSDFDAIGAEPLPEPVIARAADALAVAFVHLVHIYAPEVILLGGGVIDHHPELVTRSAAALGRYQSVLIPPGLRIERAPLSTHEAGVIGVARLALGA